jgi:hypothetical protein
MSGLEGKPKMIKELKQKFNPTHSMISSGVDAVAEPSLDEIKQKEQQALSDFFEAKEKSKLELSRNGFYFISKNGQAVGVVEKTGGRGESHYYYLIDKDGHPINNKESWEPAEKDKFQAIEKSPGIEASENIFIATQGRKNFFINEIGGKIHEGTFDAYYPKGNGVFELKKGDVTLHAKIIRGKVELSLS